MVPRLGHITKQANNNAAGRLQWLKLDPLAHHHRNHQGLRKPTDDGVGHGHASRQGSGADSLAHPESLMQLAGAEPECPRTKRRQP